MTGIAAMMHIIQVEGVFPDGTQLITVHEPIRPARRFGRRTQSCRVQITALPGTP